VHDHERFADSARRTWSQARRGGSWRGFTAADMAWSGSLIDRSEELA